MFHFRLRPKIPFKRWFRIGVFIITVVILLAAVSIWQLTAPAIGQGSGLVPFSIVAGQGVKEIGTNLKRAQLIRSTWWFDAWVRFTSTENKFMAGNYNLPSNVNLINLVRLLTGGSQPSNEITVRFIEGWTLREMGEYLERNSIMSASEFISFASTPAAFKKVLPADGNQFLQSKPASASLEGYIFPDTYRLFRGATPADLVERALQNFTRRLAIVWQSPSRTSSTASDYSIHEIITLASIVEREVATDQDRHLVADIFWRRLKASRGLEADSTINYITGKNHAAALAQDLKIDSPYNTYRYRGLPPGPISNPGLSAIEAVLYPTPNPYWYFLTTPEGKAIYSRTFEEHKAAKQKYLR